MKKKSKNIILIVIILIISAFLLYSTQISVSSYNQNDSILIINSDDTANNVIEKISKKFCISKFILRIIFRLTGQDTQIKPGKYNLSSIDNIFSLINIITSNDVLIKYNNQVVKDDRVRFTLLEGWKIINISEQLSSMEDLNIDKEKFISLCYNKKYIDSLNVDKDLTSLEGYLYPDTYFLLNNYSEKDVIELLVNKFVKIFNNKISNDLNKNYLKSKDIVILASIIESESMYIDDMPLIASVYHNRLDRNMTLDADPTILYFMSDSDLYNFKKDYGLKESRRIFNRYKKMDNGYNTYINYGLPIGPICNPSLAALETAASVKADDRDFLYFIADESGKHHFSKT